MPYERVEPAQWWQGAEAAPPMPDGKGPWALVPTAYGWEWRRTEPKTAPAPICGGTINNLLPLAALGPWPQYTLPPALPPAEVQVGDRVARSGLVYRLVGITSASRSGPATATLEFPPHTGVGTGIVWLSEIGPIGSGKPWTLLPRDPTLVAPDADTAEMVAAGLSALDRIAVLAEPKPAPYVMPDGSWSTSPAGSAGVSGAFGPLGVRGAAVLGEGSRGDPGLVGCAGPHGRAGDNGSPGQGAVFEARLAAAFEVLAEKGCDYSPYPLRVVADEALRAADAVPDPRREAERQVVEAARALVRLADAPTDADVASGFQDVRTEWEELRGALDALAALDGQGGG